MNTLEDLNLSLRAAGFLRQHDIRDFATLAQLIESGEFSKLSKSSKDDKMIGQICEAFRTDQNGGFHAKQG